MLPLRPIIYDTTRPSPTSIKEHSFNRPSVEVQPLSEADLFKIICVFLSYLHFFSCVHIKSRFGCTKRMYLSREHVYMRALSLLLRSSVIHFVRDARESCCSTRALITIIIDPIRVDGQIRDASFLGAPTIALIAR